MKHTGRVSWGQEGYVLISTLVMLMLLTLIGISMTNSTSIELLVAGSEKIHKETFYAADGATEIASELTEQNLGCVTGFTANDEYESEPALLIDNDPEDIYPNDNKVRVTKLDFWLNPDNNDPDSYRPTDDNRDFYFPSGYYEGDPDDDRDDDPHTNVTVQGDTALSPGSSIQMVSGYEGKGKGAGGGGAQIRYNIYAKHQGRQNSNTTIHIEWRHVIGQEGACLY